MALTCPNGRTTHKKYRSGSGDGCTFRLIAPQCLGCPFSNLVVAATRPHHLQDSLISDYAELNGFMKPSQTEAFKEDMKLRPHYRSASLPGWFCTTMPATHGFAA
ncbi:MAG: hypothetical protein R3E31_22205 [Chloroflexota bacterium]